MFDVCLSQAVDMEKRLRAVQEGGKTAANLDAVPTNDLEYEDKQKFQESQLVYDGLRFNLSEHNSEEQTAACLYIHNTLMLRSICLSRIPEPGMMSCQN